jgi:hypothetical protein
LFKRGASEPVATRYTVTATAIAPTSAIAIVAILRERFRGKETDARSVLVTSGKVVPKHRRILNGVRCQIGECLHGSKLQGLVEAKAGVRVGGPTSRINDWSPSGE